MHYGRVTGEHTDSTKVLCHIFDQQNKGLVKKWTTGAYEKPTSELLHVYGSATDRSKDILVFTQRGHETLSRYLDRIYFKRSNPEFLPTDFAKILRAILRMMMKVLREPAYEDFSGSIKVENIFVVDREPRLAIRSGLEDSSLGIKNFCTMVRDIWEKKHGDRSLTIELNHLITKLEDANVTVKSKEFLNAVNYPSLLSPEERVLYRSRARQKLKAMMAKNSATVTVVNKRLNRCLTHKWQSTNRPLAENKLQQGLKLTVAEYAITHKANNQLICYPDTAVGFLRFCRNLEVHMDHTKFTFEDADSDLTKYHPNFLLTLHDILTAYDIFVDPTAF
ncbi:hypothetical protein Pyn_22900 [Prunus yedoensis var. nudiflora]|uniref:Uncharacterized protein n=1 Tax=Prunus yedoensis var. nudiflora TaxID=2094558 RepID=A0A314YAE7_PRUYE|nr:hypothetical protein Pyn_22900 [Prunus yedoensis var. nudiflora]